VSIALLDVNVLLAVFDAFHSAHAVAARWLVDGPRRWATCAITENGFVRVRADPGYPAPVPVAQSVADLARARAAGGHEFWPCDVSIADASAIDPGRLLGPSAVTAAYLLALAVRHGGRLVTFDKGIAHGAVAGAGPKHLVVLGRPASRKE
jgi:toxin-antitoxin system PIN domain toxin